MSSRHYSPRRNRRRGISPRAQNSLSFLLALAIGLQMIYPFVHGRTLHVIMILAFCSGASAMLMHAFYSFGWKYAYRYLLITVLFSFLAEQISFRTGWPFGTFTYGSSLGLKVLGLPLIVPCIWVMMAHPTLVAARRVTQHWTFLYGGMVLMAWNFFLDPQIVGAQGWAWKFTGAHVPFEPEIPFSNSIGWLFVGMGLIGLLNVALPRERRKEGAEFLAVDLFLAWAFFSGIVLNVFFFSCPGIALFAGLAFGLVLTPYAFSRWLGRP